MNKKGQMNVGMIVLLVMGIIVALAILPEIFNNQASMTTLVTEPNQSITLTTTGVALNGQAVSGTPLVYNGTDGALVAASNYSVYSTANPYALYIKAVDSRWNNRPVNVSYTYEPVGYANDASSRSIAGLIGLFAVLALVAFVIGYGVKEWLENR